MAPLLSDTSLKWHLSYRTQVMHIGISNLFLGKNIRVTAPFTLSRDTSINFPFYPRVCTCASAFCACRFWCRRRRLPGELTFPPTRSSSRGHRCTLPRRESGSNCPRSTSCRCDCYYITRAPYRTVQYEQYSTNNAVVCIVYLGHLRHTVPHGKLFPPDVLQVRLS